MQWSLELWVQSIIVNHRKALTANEGVKVDCKLSERASETEYIQELAYRHTNRKSRDKVVGNKIHTMYIREDNMQGFVQRTRHLGFKRRVLLQRRNAWGVLRGGRSFRCLSVPEHLRQAHLAFTSRPSSSYSSCDRPEQRRWNHRSHVLSQQMPSSLSFTSSSQPPQYSTFAPDPTYHRYHSISSC